MENARAFAPTHQTKVTTESNLRTRENKQGNCFLIKKENLDFISKGFAGGIAAFCESNVQIWHINDFGIVSLAILEVLFNRQNETKITLPITELNLTIQIEQTNESLWLSTSSELAPIAFPNMNFQILERCLLKDIVSHYPLYPDKAMACAIERILIRDQCQDEELSRFAALSVIHLSDADTSLEQKLIAVNYCYQHLRDSKKDSTERLTHVILRAEMGLHHTKDGENPTLQTMAKQIMLNKRDYCSESVRSASIYIIFNVKHFTPELFKMAVKQYAQHPESYPKIVLTEAAIQFTRHSKDFFLAPLRNQVEFVKFYENIGKTDVIQLYSNNFKKALCLGESTVSELRETQQGLAALKLAHWWIKDHKFTLVLKANESLAIFILSNMDHEAIKLWCSRK